MIVKNMFPAVGVVLFALLTYTFVGQPGETKPIEIGDHAPLLDRKMVDVSGREVALADVAGENGLLVIFSCNTCPFVVGNGSKSEGWQGRYPDLHATAESADIGMVLVNSNEAKRESGDSMADMKEQYRQVGYRGYYVLDQDHALADAFGALVTPHVFLFDKDMKLVYTGTIDDSVNRAEQVQEPYLQNALRAVQRGERPRPAVTRHLGCSIKRVKT